MIKFKLRLSERFFLQPDILRYWIDLGSVTERVFRVSWSMEVQDRLRDVSFEQHAKISSRPLDLRPVVLVMLSTSSSALRPTFSQEVLFTGQFSRLSLRRCRQVCSNSASPENTPINNSTLKLIKIYLQRKSGTWLDPRTEVC
jgi:hypothetical protein